MDKNEYSLTTVLVVAAVGVCAGIGGTIAYQILMADAPKQPNGLVAQGGAK